MMDIVCIICSESFTETTDVYITRCGHLFDHRCLIHWMERSQSCPQCRKYCTSSEIQKVFFNLNENMPSTSAAHRDVYNHLQDAEDEDVYDLLFKADEVIRVLAETDFEEIETIFALKEKLQEKEGTILSYSDEVKHLKDEILALEIKVSSIESERERCEYKGTDLNNIMGTLKYDLRTEAEIRKDKELRLIQLDNIFLSSTEDTENVHNENVADVNRNGEERSNQLESALPITTQVPQNPIREVVTNVTREPEEGLSVFPSTSQTPQNVPSLNENGYHCYIGGQFSNMMDHTIESDGSHSQVSSDQTASVSGQSTDSSKQLLRLAKDRARIAGWKFVWRKYGNILARKEESSKILRIKNINDLNKIA